MSKITHCEVIIKDDFNNVLIIQKKVKRTEPKLWSIVGKNMRAKESPEQCANRILEKELNVVGFDITKFKEYRLDEENNKAVFSTVLKERISCHSSISNWKWISLRELENYEFSSNHKEILKDFWK